MNVTQMLKLGGLCICDSCNDAMFNSTFIGVLNRCYCETCYTEWHLEAIYYPEDKGFETTSTERLIKQLNN